MLGYTTVDVSLSKTNERGTRMIRYCDNTWRTTLWFKESSSPPPSSLVQFLCLSKSNSVLQVLSHYLSAFVFRIFDLLSAHWPPFVSVTIVALIVLCCSTIYGTFGETYTIRLCVILVISYLICIWYSWTVAALVRERCSVSRAPERQQRLPRSSSFLSVSNMRGNSSITCRGGHMRGNSSASISFETDPISFNVAELVSWWRVVMRVVVEGNSSSFTTNRPYTT